MIINDSVIVLTGASAGIGRVAAQMLAAEGARLVLVARGAEKLQELADSLPAAIAVPADVSNARDQETIAERALAAYGRIDALVNNAGRGMYAKMTDVDPDEYRELLELNLVAPLRLMQLVVPGMRAQGGGTILNVSSMVTRMYFPALSGYASTKYALNALTLTARQELAADNITVSLLRPGIVDTDFGTNAAGAEPGGARRDKDGNLMSYVLSPETVAAALVAQLKSGEAEVDLPTPIPGH